MGYSDRALIQQGSLHHGKSDDIHASCSAAGAGAGDLNGRESL